MVKVIRAEVSLPEAAGPTRRASDRASTMLHGLPDFHAPLRGEGFLLFHPFGASAATAERLASPDGLEVARGADGAPDLRLELARRPTGTSGVLDFAVAPRYAAGAALALARAGRPGATVRPAPFAGGFLRLLPVGAVPGMAPDALAALVRPVPLAWGGAEAARFRVALDEEAASLVRGALEGGLLTFSAYAEVELAGVAPRLDARLRFDPAALVEALAEGAGAERVVSRDALFLRFRDRIDALPLEIEGRGAERATAEERADVLTHFVHARLGRLAPAPAPSRKGETFVALAAPDEAGRGRSEWDLSSPWPAGLPAVLELRPLEEARRMADGGAAALVRRTDVPALETGDFRLSVRANLPAGCGEVEEVAVQVYAPARPGRRAVAATLRLFPPAFAAAAPLRFVPGEAPEYRWRAEVVLADGRVLSWGDDADAGMAASTSADLVIGPDDLPARVVSVHPDPALADAAALRCVCAWREARRDGEIELARARTLAPGVRGGAAFVLPLEARGATLFVEARDAEGRTVTLGPVEARSLRPGFYSFPEHGPHEVELAVDADHPVLVELVAEDRPDAAADTLAFQPGDGARWWGWMARSPFRPGFRWRARADAPGAAPGAWTTVHPPFRLPCDGERAIPRFTLVATSAGFDLSLDPPAAEAVR